MMSKAPQGFEEDSKSGQELEEENCNVVTVLKQTNRSGPWKKVFLSLKIISKECLLCVFYSLYATYEWYRMCSLCGV